MKTVVLLAALAVAQMAHAQTQWKLATGYRAESFHTRNVVQFAAKLAGAPMRGVWREAGRMVLEGVLSILGIDPAAFYAFIGQAETVISALINNPGQFVSNLANAVRQGFEQFGKNILQHLKKSLIDWLFG